MKMNYDCRFQGRENKRNQLKELREQFEKDKQRIQKMKENRKFNPVLTVCLNIVSYFSNSNMNCIFIKQL